MAQGGRSILATIFKNFVNSLKPRSIKGEVAGKDHLGNTYYYISGTTNQRKQRWFTPKTDFEQEIPAEWESWLRYRRREPPTEEEVLANDALAKIKKVNAAKLDSERKAHVIDNPPQQNVTPGNFPVYKEYESVPGDRNKID